MADKAKGFWSSIPGILTGIAAVITATTGLYIAINGNGPATEKATTTPPTPPPRIEPKNPSPEKPGNASPLGAEAIDNLEATAQKLTKRWPKQV